MKGYLKKLIVIMLAACLLLAVSCDSQLMRQGQGKVHIVVAGLDYRNTQYVPTLTGTLPDAREICACLEEQYRNAGVPFETVCLLAEGALANPHEENYPSATNILKTIAALETSPEDLIVFFYSGHGGAYNDGEGKPTGRAFLACGMEIGLPYGLYTNGRLRDTWFEEMLAMGYTADEIVTCASGTFPYTDLPMENLFMTLSAKNCRSVAMIDACYAGALTDLVPEKETGWKEAFEDTLLAAADYRGVSVIASSTAYEESLICAVINEDGERERHSFFTYDLLDALGWTHATERQSTYDGNGKTGGYVAKYRSGLTVQDVREAIRVQSTGAQTYTAAFTGLDTVLIPER